MLEALTRLTDWIDKDDKKPSALSLSAVNRWVITGLMRSQIVNSLLEITDMKNCDSDNNELNKHQIQRDKKDLENLKKYISATINPFKSNIKKDVVFDP